MTTNQGKKFLALVEKHFPKTNPLNKIFNRNTMKISYSCTRNVKAIIQGHNRKLLSRVGNVKSKKRCDCNSGPYTRPTRDEDKRCNCQVSRKHLCPMGNDCHHFNVIYQATTREAEPKIYIGCTENFKRRYSGHKSSFKNFGSRFNTTLSRHVWEQKLGEDPDIEWKILCHAPSYKLGGRSCDLS